jgi:hypothetical protein
MYSHGIFVRGWREHWATRFQLECTRTLLDWSAEDLASDYDACQRHNPQDNVQVRNLEWIRGKRLRPGLAAVPSHTGAWTRLPSLKCPRTQSLINTKNDAVQHWKELDELHVMPQGCR